jgi:hypothetical protein
MNPTWVFPPVLNIRALIAAVSWCASHHSRAEWPEVSPVRLVPIISSSQRCGSIRKTVSLAPRVTLGCVTARYLSSIPGERSCQPREMSKRLALRFWMVLKRRPPRIADLFVPVRLWSDLWSDLFCVVTPCIRLTEYRVYCVPGGMHRPRVFLGERQQSIGDRIRAGFKRCEITDETQRPDGHQVSRGSAKVPRSAAALTARGNRTSAAG